MPSEARDWVASARGASELPEPTYFVAMSCVEQSCNPMAGVLQRSLPGGDELHLGLDCAVVTGRQLTRNAYVSCGFEGPTFA